MRVVFGEFAFDFTTRQIPGVAHNTKLLGHTQRKPSIADALNAAANEIVFRSNHDTGSLALFHALIPPTTLAMS